MYIMDFSILLLFLINWRYTFDTHTVLTPLSSFFQKCLTSKIYKTKTLSAGEDQMQLKPPEKATILV